MRTSEKQELKKKIKRLGWFLLIVFIPMVVVSSLLIIAKQPQWLNIMVLVVLMFILFGAYLKLLEKFDKKKEERMDKKKDPFSD